MRELVGGKNTIGRTAAVLKKSHEVTFKLFYSEMINFCQTLTVSLLLDIFMYRTRNRCYFHIILYYG